MRPECCFSEREPEGQGTVESITGKYGLVILTTLRIVGVLFVLGLTLYVILMLRRERAVPGGVKVAG